jgi:prophage regulatory protein
MARPRPRSRIAPPVVRARTAPDRRLAVLREQLAADEPSSEPVPILPAAPPQSRPQSPRAPPQEGLVVLRRREVMRRTGLPQSSLYELVAAGEFPKPIALSRRRVGWIAGEVEDWIKERIAARPEPEPPESEPDRPRQRLRSRSEAEI